MTMPDGVLNRVGGSRRCVILLIACADFLASFGAAPSLFMRRSGPAVEQRIINAPQSLKISTEIEGIGLWTGRWTGR
jgi:hypothetical protein